MNALIVILGPTGVGKTELCLSVAEYFSIPIINADSRQIYKEIPIGTAAPTPVQQSRVKHYLVGTHSLEDYYSASMFEQDVLQILEKRFSSTVHPLYNGNRLALMTGGSMMYIDAVCNGIDDIPTVDNKTREWMKQRYEEEGLEKLCEELEQLDPEYHKTVDRKNYRRVVHALEIIHCSGQTYSSLRTNHKKQRPFRIIKIGLERPREELYERINLRVDHMMKEGMLEEAQNVYDKRHLNALNTVGYKELFAYLDNTWTLDEAVERIKGNSRRYCRKQLTWFKRDKDVKWFNLSTPQPHQENNITKEIIKYITYMI